jgi:signal peptidase I
MDATTETTNRSPRSPGIAVLLGVLFPGLGHQYVGEPRIALRVLLCIGVGWPIVLALAVLVDRDPLLTLAFSIGIGISVQLGLGADAYRRAKRHGDRYELRPCNRGGAYLRYIALWLVLVLVPSELRTMFVVESFSTTTSSFEPTLRAGDRFVVTKLTSRDRNPQRGDIVVFEYPDDPRERFVKRLIGLPGETVAIYGDGSVEVDGVPLVREAVAAPQGAKDNENAWYFLERTPEGASYVVRMITVRDELVDAPTRAAVYEVPAGTMFVIGDNRNQSHDSREFGPVKLSSLVGRARAIWSPMRRAGDLH